MSKNNSAENAGRWNSKSLGSTFFHNLFYALIRLAGRRVGYVLLFFVVSFYCMLPKIRKRASYYLRRRFPHAGNAAMLLHTFRLYWNFGQMLVDRTAFKIINDFKLTGNKTNEEQLSALYDENKRLIVMTGHMGCWQMGISYLKYLQGPKAVIMLKADEKADLHSFKMKNSDTLNENGEFEKITIINPEGHLGGTLEMLNALNNNCTLCVTGDRIFGDDKNTVEVDFLGGTIRLPISAYKLSATTRTPIAIAFSTRNGSGTGNFKLAKTVSIPKNTGKGSRDKIAAFKPYAQEFARELEQYCQENPYQFYNFFNMWQ